MSQPKVGLQLYTLREEMNNDYKGTLAAVAQIGYKAVEFAGYGDLNAQEMNALLDDLGLVAPASHVGIDRLKTNLQQEIEFALETGIQYLICPHLSLSQHLREEENFGATMATLRQIGATCQQHGIKFGYHNHDFEFTQTNGRYILDRMFAAVPAELMVAELDLYWVAKGGADPISYLKQYTGRCPLIHVKDMTNDSREANAEVGYGKMDYPAILEAAEQAGVKYYIVEQDHCDRPPLQSVKMSFDYLQKLGFV